MNYGRQVAELRNSRAQLDFPVGILCSALRGIGMKDIEPQVTPDSRFLSILTRSDAFIMEGTEQRWRNRLAPIFLNFS